MGVEHNPNGKPVNRAEYEWKTASVTAAGTAGTTDLSAETGFTTLFDTINPAYYVSIQASATTYIRINSATADKITVDSSNPFISDRVEVTAIYYSTNGGASTITVRLH